MEKEKLIQEVIHSTDALNLPQHSHANYQMIYVKKGTIHLDISSKKYTVCDHSLLFISNLEQHYIEVISDEYERYFVIISAKEAEHLIKNQKLLSIFSNRPEGFVHVLKVSKIKDLINIIFEKFLYEYQKDDLYSNEISTLLLKGLLLELNRFKNDFFPVGEMGISRVVWDMKKFLEENASNNITLSFVADKFHMNLYYLSHSFKKITGYSIKQYLMLCRLSLARDLLGSTNLNIIEVALRSGFTDHSNFTRFFIREIGYTPSEYRKLQNKQ